MNKDKFIKQITTLTYGKDYNNIPYEDLLNKVKEWKECAKVLAMIKSIVSEVDYSDTSNSEGKLDIEAFKNLEKKWELEDKLLIEGFKRLAEESSEDNSEEAGWIEEDPNEWGIIPNYTIVAEDSSGKLHSYPMALFKERAKASGTMSASFGKLGLIMPKRVEQRAAAVEDIMSLYKMCSYEFDTLSIHTQLKGIYRGRGLEKKLYNDHVVEMEFDLNYDYAASLQKGIDWIQNNPKTLYNASEIIEILRDLNPKVTIDSPPDMLCQAYGEVCDKLYTDLKSRLDKYNEKEDKSLIYLKNNTWYITSLVKKSETLITANNVFNRGASKSPEDPYKRAEHKIKSILVSHFIPRIRTVILENALEIKFIKDNSNKSVAK